MYQFFIEDENAAEDFHDNEDMGNKDSRISTIYYLKRFLFGIEISIG